MAKKKTKDTTKSSPISFRFYDHTIEKLKVLADFQRRSASNMVEILIEDAFEELKRKHPDDVRRIEKNLKK